MKIVATVVMFVMGSLGIESQAWPLQDRQGTNFTEPQVQPQPQQQSSGNVSPLLNTKPSAGTGQANSDQHDENSRPKGETEYIQYWLVALTLLQAIIIFFQTVYTRRDANAAQDSAAAATKSAEVAERALKTVERARLVIQWGTLDEFLADAPAVVNFKLVKLLVIGGAGFSVNT